MNLRHLVIRTLTKRYWRASPARQRAALLEFGHIEKDSGAQLRRCVSLTQDPELGAYLFQHVLEEYFHADIFADAAHERAERHLVRTIPDRVPLIAKGADDKEILDFFAYVHVGEALVNRDFGEYAAAARDAGIRRVFLRAGADEKRHEEDTHNILTQLAQGDERRAHAAARRARLRLSWRTFVDAMHTLGTLPMVVLLGTTYFCFGWVGVRASRRRLRLGREAQARILSAQVQAFGRGQP
jgi:hypothetical protein